MRLFIYENKWKQDGKEESDRYLSDTFFFFFLGLKPWHMEVPSLEVKSELQLPIPQPWQHQILNPLSKARDRTCILMDTNGACWPLSHNGNS